MLEFKMCREVGNTVDSLGYPVTSQDILVNSFLAIASIHQTTAQIPSNLSIASTWAWYMALTPYESIFLNLFMFQIVILRYLEILPISLNDLFLGEPSGRRKRAVSTPFQKFCNGGSMSQNLFELLRKADEHDCFLRTLCELESVFTLRSSKLSEEVELILSALRVSRKRRIRLEKEAQCGLQTKSWGVTPFEEAVELGSKAVSANSTACETRYNICPISRTDILYYVNKIF